MAVYTLERGLVLQIGDPMWEFDRQLDADTVQLVHQTTGRASQHRLSKLTRDIASGKVTIVRSMPPQTAAGSRGSSPTIFCADSLKDAHKNAYLRAHNYVAAMRKRGISKGQRSRIANAVSIVAAILRDRRPPRASTVMRWMRLYEGSGCNASSLVSGHAHRQRRKRVSQYQRDVVKATLQRRYFIRNGCSLRSAHENVIAQLERAADHGTIDCVDAKISLSTVRRIAYETEPFYRDRARMGTTSARAKWRFATHGGYASRPLERVEMDHTLLDLWVIDDRLGIPLGRPTLTLLVCTYSGYINGFYISFEGESLARMLRSIKIAVQPKEPLLVGTKLDNPWHACGLWETLVVDNAKACHSETFKQVGIELSMDIEYCPVRQPWFKPVVERYIGEACRQLPVPGRPQRPGRHPEPIDPQKTACVTFSDLCKCILKWVVDVHPFMINERTLTRPVDLFLEGVDKCPAPAFVESFANLDVLAGVAKTVTVDHSGIVREWLQYANSDLRVLRQSIGTKFKTLCKLDPYDLGHIFVQDPRDATWIKVSAKDQEYASGLTLTQHRLIRAAAKERLSHANADTVLRRARLELQEQWAHAVRSGKRVKDARSAALSEEQNSLHVFDPRSRSGGNATERSLIVEENVRSVPQSIPTFETFRVRNIKT
ncbi:TniA putative transposase (plasmid) [Paraburkholderia caribensis MBA4]|uniref:TniA putative transposase n=2 Tax=Paraburkholderia caribensis TaxID=75105 RepID=A0A0P0RRG2_9BURK|nr:TniA putative transposase [Paraburkholderia caribensis MBA4]